MDFGRPPASGRIGGSDGDGNGDGDGDGEPLLKGLRRMEEPLITWVVIVSVRHWKVGNVPLLSGLHRS